MDKKIVFFDIDGTLVGSSRKVTEKNKEAVQQLRKNGHLALICTGRSPASIEKSLVDIGFDGIVASAGSLVLINNELIFENFIAEYLLSEVMLLFVNHNILFSLEAKDAIYQAPGIKNFFDKMKKELFKENLELARTFEDREKNDNRKELREFDIHTTPIMKLCFISQNKENFRKCEKFLSEFFNIVIFSKEDEPHINGEIILKHCTKGDALKFVCNYFNKPISNSIAYGDSMNDHEMLLEAGYSVASKKASDYLISIADDTFEEPDEDGIYNHLVKLGLI